MSKSFKNTRKYFDDEDDDAIANNKRQRIEKTKREHWRDETAQRLDRVEKEE